MGLGSMSEKTEASWEEVLTSCDDDGSMSRMSVNFGKECLMNQNGNRSKIESKLEDRTEWISS